MSAPRTVVLLVAIATGSCGRADLPDRGAATTDAAPTGEILVSAASSLTEALRDVETAFEAAHPGTTVLLNFAGSSSLRTQILEGAPVDVFAPASSSHLRAVVEAGLASAPARVIARNALQIAVPAANPGRVAGLEDFANEGLRLGLCAEEVPCGALARAVLARAGITPALDTREPNVRSLLTKIELGELDAGITYVTDVASRPGTVRGIDVPEELNVVAEYPVVVLDAAPNPAAAEAFVRFLLSGDGRVILERHGFVVP